MYKLCATDTSAFRVLRIKEENLDLVRVVLAMVCELGGKHFRLFKIDEEEGKELKRQGY